MDKDNLGAGEFVAIVMAGCIAALIIVVTVVISRWLLSL